MTKSDIKIIKDRYLKRYAVKLAAAVLFLLIYIFLSGKIYAFDIESASPYAKTIKNYDTAYSAMYIAMYNTESELNISELKIKDNEIIQIYSDIRNNSPELFYLENRLLYYYNSYGYVTSVKFSYTMPPEELAEARKKYDAEVSYIASLTKSSMTDLEKVLFIHDYFVSSFSYDTSMRIYDAYGLLSSRKGVCQAYSLAYMAVLRECGISAVMVTSQEMNHAWNLVMLDGNWYHVDLSYDDPSPDRMGMVFHENFLLSDDAVRSNHHGWVSVIRCGSQKYDDAYWKNIQSKMAYINSYWYYIDEKNSSIVKSLYDEREKSTVYTFTDKWYVVNKTSSFWRGIFSGCAEYLDYLYFNTPDSILVYSTDDGSISTLIQNKDSKTDFYGLAIYKNSVEYIASDKPDSPNIYNKYKFELSDFNLDYMMNAAFPFEDVPRLSKYYPAVRFVYNNNIFNGMSKTEFSPDSGMTRAMFVTVLGRLCSVDTDIYTGTSFTDVAENEWYSPYVEWASENGIVNGIGNNMFNPDGMVTYEQMYKIIRECAVYLNCGGTDISYKTLPYVDRKQVSEWAYDGVAFCHANKLIGEAFSAYLKPKKIAVRAEVAEIVYKFALMFLDYNS